MGNPWEQPKSNKKPDLSSGIESSKIPEAISITREEVLNALLVHEKGNEQALELFRKWYVRNILVK